MNFEKMKDTNMVEKKLESRQALVAAASLEQIEVGKMYVYVLVNVTYSIDVRSDVGRELLEAHFKSIVMNYRYHRFRGCNFFSHKSSAVRRTGWRVSVVWPNSSHVLQQLVFALLV